VVIPAVRSQTSPEARLPVAGSCLDESLGGEFVYRPVQRRGDDADRCQTTRTGASGASSRDHLGRGRPSVLPV